MLLKVPALVLVALMLTGCSLSKDQPAPAGPDQSSAKAGFTARTASGDPITIPGGRPSVVLFFSAECGGCGPTATALAQVQADGPDAANFVVVDMAAHETEKDIKGFLDKNDAAHLGYVSDDDGRLTARYRVTRLTTILILDAANQVAFRAVEPSVDQIRTELAKVSQS